MDWYALAGTRATSPPPGARDGRTGSQGDASGSPPVGRDRSAGGNRVSAPPPGVHSLDGRHARQQPAAGGNRAFAPLSGGRSPDGRQAREQHHRRQHSHSEPRQGEKSERPKVL